MYKSEKEKIRCQYCGVTCVSVNRLDFHVKSFHFVPVYRCGRCLRQFQDSTSLKAHQNTCN